MSLEDNRSYLTTMTKPLGLLSTGGAVYISMVLYLTDFLPECHLNA